MMHLVVYDIEEDDVRLRIAKALKNVGQRVQKSVFECSMDAREMKGLLAVLKKILKDSPEGNIRLYRLCTDCHSQSVELGEENSSIYGKSCIII